MSELALVTGGSRGIGRAVALRLAREGFDVAFTFFRNREGAEKTAGEIEERGRRCLVERLHAGDAGKVQAFADRVLRDAGPPNVVVHNAASGVFRPLAGVDERAWAWTMDVNARALLVLANALAPPMRENGGGSIVALTSIGSRRVLPGYGAVGASKAACESLVRYLAVELAPSIRVNAVCAGAVDTESLRKHPAHDEIFDRVRDVTPAGRAVTEDDVAAAVGFLCSEAAWMIRGHTLDVDGGLGLLS